MNRRVPFIQQMEAVECGAASLAMILAYHGHHAPLGEVREACGVSRDGAPAKGIVAAARSYGLTARARRLEPADLAALRGPAILHWEMNHFVVLRRWTPKRAHLVDPALGPRDVSVEDFDRSFTGICVEFELSPSFRKRPRRPFVMRRLRSLLAGSGAALGLVLGATLVLMLLQLGLPLLTQVLIDQVLFRGQVDWFRVILFALAALVAGRFALSVVRGWVLASLQRFLDVSISLQFVRHLLRLPMRFFLQRSSADLVSRVQSSTQVREVLAGQSLGLLVDGLLLVLSLAMMILIDATLGAIVAAAGGLYAVVFLAARPAEVRRFQDRQIKQVAEYTELYQMLKGIVTLKSSGFEGTSRDRWMNLHVGTLNAEAAETRLGERVGGALLLLRALVPAAVVFVGVEQVLAGTMSIGMLVSFQLLQQSFLGPLDQVVRTLLQVQGLSVLVTRMDDVLEAEPEEVPDAHCPPLEGGIRFEGVSFRYAAGEPLVLDGVDFAIDKGQKVALVGPSGSGKSTLARLMLGLYRPTAGRVMFDGTDLAAVDPDSVRRQIGAVLQETLMLNATVRENISLYSPSAPLEEVVAAARVAQIHDDIQALPLGYDTALSAAGGALSGGQRQRIALARAVLHHPAIMLLDEATSALDPVTEAAIARYLSLRRCTRVVIAHRLSTVRDADRILVLGGGRVVEDGSHDDLLARGGAYAALVAQGQRREEAAPRQAAPARSIGVDDLRPFELLSGLSQEEREALLPLLQRTAFDAGAVVLNQDSAPSGLFLVESGRVEVRIAEPGLPAYTVAALGPGEAFGEVSVLDGSPNSATVAATEETRLLVLPLRRFQELKGKRDILAMRLLLGLGRLVSRRIRETTSRELEAGPAAPVAAAPASGGGPTLRLGDTPLGSALSAGELAFLEGLGRVTRFAAGEVLFREGTTGEEVSVLLAGRVGVGVAGAAAPVEVLRPGALFGEVSFFDGGVRAATCTALKPSTVFSLPTAALHQLLAGGNIASWKVLSHLAQTLVWYLRLSNIRLRQRVAERNHEADKALEARRMARAEQQLMAEDGEASDGRQPVIVREPRLEAGACLAWILRTFGRPAPVFLVAEACAAGGGGLEGLAEGARQYGLWARQLGISARQLRYIDAPLVLAWDEDRLVVAYRWRGGRLGIMDPAAGYRDVPAAEVAQRYAGRCVEVLRETAGGTGEGLVRKVTQFVAERRGAVARLVGTTFLLQLAELAIPLTMGLVIEQVLPTGDRSLLSLIAVGLLALVGFRLLLTWSRGRLLLFLRTFLDRDLHGQFVGHLLRLPVNYFERRTPAEMLQLFEGAGVLRDDVAEEGFATAFDLGVVAVSIGAAALWSPALAAVLGLAAVVQLGVLAAAYRPLDRLARTQVRASAEQNDRLLELLAGITTARAIGEPDSGLHRWMPAFLRETASAARQERLGALLLPALVFVHDAVLALTLAWGAALALQGRLSVGPLVALLGIAVGCTVSLQGLAAQFLAYVGGGVYLRQLRGFFREPAEQAATVLATPGKLRGRIELESVSFRYDPDGPAVLQEISLAIESGMKVAIVGRSGSGKSTLGKLLLGLYLPVGGRVLFDGRDVARLDLRALRRQIGVVLQDVFLFGASIRQNLTLTAPGATLEEIEAAARKASIHEDIAALPMGYETILAEGAATLSGGQRQRLAIARALVHRPAVLLLDEATSALDNIAQAVVERNLSQEGCTRIVVAHRLSTVEDADLIVVLDAGRIVEAGRHAELLAKRGHYFRLAQVQLAGGPEPG